MDQPMEDGKPPSTPRSLPPLKQGDDVKRAVNLLSKCAIRTTAEYPGTEIPGANVEENTTFEYTETKAVPYNHEGVNLIIIFYHLADGRGWVHDFSETDPCNVRSIQHANPDGSSAKKLSLSGKVHLVSPEVAKDVIQLQQEKSATQAKLESQTKELEQTKQMYQMLAGEYMTLQKKHKQLHKNTTALLWEHLKDCGDASVSHIPAVDKSMQVTVGHVGGLTIGTKIGEGEFAKVHECDGQAAGPPAAVASHPRCVKMIEKGKITSLGALKRVNKEIRALRRITGGGRCRGSLDLHEVIHTPSHLCLVTDKGPRDLFEYLNGYESGLPDALARQVARGIAEAVHDIHAVGVAHRDLKPENILVHAVKPPSDAADEPALTNARIDGVNLCDFGLCAVEGLASSDADADACEPGGVGMGVGTVEPQFFYTDFCGSQGFFAPEMVVARKHLPKPADVWSMGCVFLELILGHQNFYEVWVRAYDTRLMRDPPQFGKRIAAALIEVEKRLEGLTTTPEAALPGGAKDLVLRMLKIDAGDRLTSAEVLGHPWLVDSDLPLASVAPAPPAAVALETAGEVVLPSTAQSQSFHATPTKKSGGSQGAAVDSSSAVPSPQPRLEAPTTTTTKKEVDPPGPVDVE